ncbi:MAG: DnaJ domain-containing protein, partial [Pirellula sp.]
MSDKTEAVKRHLGREISERELTHYSLLGVSNDASVEQIRVAIRVRVAAFNASDVKNAPESAQLAATMIKQAQAVLLDNVKRREYDLSLAVKQPTIQLALFPDADPFATFNPAECLVGAVAALPTEPFGNPSQRWQELKSKLPILAEWESVPPQKPTPTILLAEPPHPRADAGQT